MIEVIAVLIVMAIVSSLIAYRGTTHTNELLTEAEILTSHLRYAQIRAMNATVPWGIHVDGAGAYSLYVNNVEADADYILPGETEQTHKLSTGVIITSGIATYNFNDWGSPGTADLTITLTQGTSTNTIPITKNTGFIP